MWRSAINMKCNVDFAFKTNCSRNPLKLNDKQNSRSYARCPMRSNLLLLLLFFCGTEYEEGLETTIWHSIDRGWIDANHLIKNLMKRAWTWQLEFEDKFCDLEWMMQSKLCIRG